MDLPAPLTVGRSEFLENILKLDSSVFGYMVRNYGVGGEGGFLHICDIDGKEMLHRMIGDPDPSMIATRSAAAREQAHRLLSHPDHFLASESFDFKREKTCGAVRMENGLIVSFSTLTERTNEPFCAAIGNQLQMASVDYLINIMSITRSAELFLEINQLLSGAVGDVSGTPILSHTKKNGPE